MFTRHFQMCDAARHEGDLEAVTVFVNSATHRPIGVGTTRHGHVHYTLWETTLDFGYPAEGLFRLGQPCDVHEYGHTIFPLTSLRVP